MVFSDDEDDETVHTSKKKNKKQSKQKKAVIFDSDSDNGDFVKSPPSAKKAKRKKKGIVPDSGQVSIADAFKRMQYKSNESKPVNSKIKQTPQKESAPEKPSAKKQISAADFFGVETVKRVDNKEKKPVKRKAEDEFDDFEMHDDDDFEKTLAQLDEQQPCKKVRVEDTPSPKAQNKSLSSKLSAKAKKDKGAENGETSKSLKTPQKSKSPGKKTLVKMEITPKPATQKKTPVKMEITPPKPVPQKKTPVKAEKSPTNIAQNKKTQDNNESATAKKTTPEKPELQRKGTGYRAYLHREPPRFLGSKEIPEGGENCLEGLTFVITGVLESLERDETKSLVEKYGGKVTGNVSKKTSYIVVGRDSGESKMAKARQFGTNELDEDGLLDLIRTLPGKKSKYEIEAEKDAKRKTPGKKASINNNDKSPPTDTATTPGRHETSQKRQKFANITPEKKPSIKTPMTTPKSVTSSPSVSRSSSQATASPQVNQSFEKSEHTLLWVDKYKPTQLKQIIGQQGDKSNARKLQNWLKNWHKNRTLGKKPAFNRFNDDGSGHRAALLSGPPGVGKTTTSVIVCQEADFSYVELNASDTRSKKSLKTEVAEALGNHTLVDFFGAKSDGKSDGHKHCLIMDEVDGMAGNEDRGGMQELIQLIKTTKIPIICMCNDRMHSKVRSLANYCFDLRFQRPRVEQIKSAMMSIAFKEGVKIPPPALNEIIGAANQDVRQVLHNLSMWTAREKNLSYDQIKKDAASAKKDLKIGPFDVCRKVFVGGEETSKMTLNDKSDLFFQDYSIGPLFVQENYLSVIPYAAKGSIAKHLECISRAADSLTDSDMVDRHVRSGQNWSLLPIQAMYASVIPGQIMRGSLGERVEFPCWLGKNSTTNKNNRLLQELKTHMRLKVCTDKKGLNLEYIPHLRHRLTEPLFKHGTDGVKDVIEIMDDYDLLREDFDSILEVSKWPGAKDPMSQIETKTKAAFTRTYNKESHLTPYSTVATAKKGKGRKGGGGGEQDEMGEGMEGEESTQPVSSGEEEDDPLADGMIKAKKSTAAKKTTTSKAKGDSKKTGSKGKASVSKGRGKKK